MRAGGRPSERTEGRAWKRLSPIQLVPLGCRAGTGGGPVGEATGTGTRLGPPPRPSTSVHMLVDAKKTNALFMCFSPYLGVSGGGVGGVPKGARAKPPYAAFQPRWLKNGNFRN